MTLRGRITRRDLLKTGAMALAAGAAPKAFGAPALKHLKPDVEFVAERFAKFGTVEMR